MKWGARPKLSNTNEFITMSKSMNIKQLAAHYHVCISTITNWRRELGVSVRQKKGPHNRIKYDLMHRMLRDGLSDREIAKACGCSAMTVCIYREKRELRRKTMVSYPDAVVNWDYAQIRRDVEIATAKRLGMDMDTFKSVWLRGKVWTLECGFVDARGY